jgi:hypothetical protein
MSEKRDIAKDRAMCEAATKGPWKGGVYCVWAGEKYVAGTKTGIGESAERANMRFIAESREALPHYLTRTETAEQRVAEVEAGNAGFRKCLQGLVDAIREMEGDIPDSAMHTVYASEMEMARLVLKSDGGKATLEYIGRLERKVERLVEAANSTGCPPPIDPDEGCPKIGKLRTRLGKCDEAQEHDLCIACWNEWAEEGESK